MKKMRWLVVGLMMLVNVARSQQDPVKSAGPITREWTNLDGRKLKAEYLGIQGQNVALKLQSGKITFIPSLSLSPADNTFIRDNRLEFHAPWRAWPPDAGMGMQYSDVREESVKDGEFIYTTPHFRFHSDVNLGATLMKDIARIFELTLHLHSKSPFGILGKPEKDLYEARLFGTLADYRKAGSPVNSAGVYLHKEKVFLAPLELMGMKPSTAGWRRISENYDVSTIVHELTHMLTHDMLDNLPTWANEGYAEYISNMPIKANAFKTDAESIREGVREKFVTDFLKSKTRPGEKLPDMSRAERMKYLEGGTIPSLNKIAHVLRMTDVEWATGVPPLPKPGDRPVQPMATSGSVDRNRLPRLYQTSHLIFYYFIQIEGEKGVSKIRRFLETNRGHLASYDRYLEDHAAFEKEWAAFMSLPGVVKLPDDRIQYPSNLKPPEQPKPPFTDPNILKLGGLDSLLGGESAEVVGARIETALVDDLKMKLKFALSPGGR